MAPLFSSSRTLIWFVHKVGLPTMFKNLDSTFEDVQGGKIIFTIKLKSPDECCRDFFIVSKGIYTALPETIGLRRNTIEAEIGETQCRYIIVPPLSRTIYTRIKIAFKAIFATNSVLDEMSYQQKELQKGLVDLKKSYDRLLESQKERQKLIDYIQQVNESLEQKVEERTRELNDKTISLTLALKEKKHLLEIISHDIATPITIADWSLKKVVKNKLEHSNFIRVTKAQQAIEAIIEITNTVKLLEGIESDKVRIKLAPTNISETIKKSLSLFEDKFNHKNIEVVTNIPEHIKAYADHRTLGNSIINNIISNAIKFSPVGGKIKVDLIDKKNDVSLIIIDNGIGMDEKLLNKIFDFDKQTSRPGTNGELGTGFGLPIVKMLLDHYDAEIKVASKPIEKFPNNHGTTFIITFRKELSMSA